MISTTKIPASLFSVATLPKSIFSTTAAPKSIYSVAGTPFINSTTSAYAFLFGNGEPMLFGDGSEMTYA